MNSKVELIQHQIPSNNTRIHSLSFDESSMIQIYIRETDLIEVMSSESTSNYELSVKVKEAETKTQLGKELANYCTLPVQHIQFAAVRRPIWKMNENVKFKLHDDKVLHNPKLEYRTTHRYCGKVKAVIFDWGGTTVDCGVFAPLMTFKKIFATEDVIISDSEARGPMGVNKRTHIKKILEHPEVRERWKKQHNQLPTEDDVDRMYQNYIPEQLLILQEHSKLIEGTADTINTLRNEFGVKIGTTTGYPRVVLQHLLKLASAQGFQPDMSVAADEVPESRPCPHMVWLNAVQLNAYPIEAIVKVDDTSDGVKEGLTAGCWSVGVAKTGNYMSASESDLETMNAEEYDYRLQKAYNILGNAGAHYVIDSVASLPVVIADINRRLQLQDRP